LAGILCRENPLKEREYGYHSVGVQVNALRVLARRASAGDAWRAE
jgi:hypothetical protein